ncbi:glutamate racemase [Pseudoalteromonas galatheae]|uniref:glutamate racemase n=1 Tax=Pseudoalteromonas galatheae TaxID=579562 RepID=UPI0011080231|nr:glutamate racemase [Pseudoalteromonas galatheae]NKC17352.1 glutamate racemase [Pseudoalteromonas galatheae]
MRPSILVFDSGVGGLSIVTELMKQNPSLNIDYVFDRDYFPYGSKSESELVPRVIQILRAAIGKRPPEAIVIACNTISTIALTQLRQEFKLPIIGVVPAIKPASTISLNKSFVVLGTELTINSKYVNTLIDNYAANCNVQLFPSQRLVIAAEEKIMGKASYLNGVAKELSAIAHTISINDCDVVVLACTHYPLILEEISTILPAHIKIIDSGEAVANRVQEILSNISEFTNNTSFPGALSINVVDSLRRHDIEPQRIANFLSCQSSLSYLDIIV